MVEHGTAARQSGALLLTTQQSLEQDTQDIFRAAATLANKDEYGTLVLDVAGIIRSCGTAAGRIFGSGAHELVGSSIAALIADFFPSVRGRGYRSRYLAHINEIGWRKFNAVD